MSAVVGQSLLTMALRDGNISSSEAREIVKQLKRRRLSPQRSDVRATFMADLNLAMTDTEAAKVENLAAKFEEIAFFREFILLDGEGDMDLA
jgi:polyhydroxyalkanoate synthesis regulator phasin